MSKQIDETNTPLEFPCDFPLKVMGRDKEDFRDHILSIVHEHAGKDRVVSVRDRESSKGRFISITVTVTVDSRPELDTLYRALNDSDRVLMTL